MHAIGGYLKSSGNLNIQEFSTSNTLNQLASQNTANLYIIPDDNVPIFDQGTINSCVANSSVAALEMLRALNDLSSVKALSRLFVYWNARSVSGMTNEDKGTFIHDAFGSLAKLGICEESIWAYNTSEVFAQPPINAYKEGNDNTITNFYQIVSGGKSRCNDIELAIRANHPVVFGTTVGQELESYFGNNDAAFNPPADSLGGHAIIAMGVRTNADGNKDFLIRNSWGNMWGLGGKAWFSSDYMAWDETNDLFVPTLMKDFLL